MRLRGYSVVAAFTTVILAAGSPESRPDVLLSDDFEDGAFVQRWDIGSQANTWPPGQFVQCGAGIGFRDNCAAWSNRLLFDGYFGFWGYDAWRPFVPHAEFYVRWYQYVSESYTWGTLEDKSLILHDPDATITAYIAISRNHLPLEQDSGPGLPFLANYQDVDWPDTGGQYTRVNRFQNRGNNIVLQPGRWYLFEWYVRLNTPGASDGITRLWIDDATHPIVHQTLRMEYDDVRWLRSTDAGRAFGFIRLTAYHQRCDVDPTTCPPNGPAVLDQWQRWDHVVVSTTAVGPVPPSPAPRCDAARAVPDVLWPPDRRLVPIQVQGVTHSGGQPVTIAVETVTHNEPAGGAGGPDALVHGGAALVRAARDGNGSGRIYEVGFVATDADGAACNGTVRVTVPHSRRPSR